MASHSTQIPEAVRIAASVDPSISQELKQEALAYLVKVKDLGEETWQDCLALYLQGAGASGSGTGKDGKQKQGSDLRVFCEQVVDDVLINKSGVLSQDALNAVYSAIMEFVDTEYVQGSAEDGQAFFRNKLSFTIAHLFIHTYENQQPEFLKSFVSLLASPSPPFHAPLLSIRLIYEIAGEIHDATLRSARAWSDERFKRDGVTRDMIRTRGDGVAVINALFNVVRQGVERVEAGERGKWVELVEWAIIAIAAWTPWVDIGVTLTQDNLALLSRLLQHSETPQFVTPAAQVLRAMMAKGIKEHSEKIEILKFLGVVALIDPLETQSAAAKRNGDDVELVRPAYGSVYSQYGVELVKLLAESDLEDSHRAQAEQMLNDSLPLLIRFLTDRQIETSNSVFPYLSDLLKSYKKFNRKQPVVANPTSAQVIPAPPPTIPLPDDKRRFLLSLLQVLITQLEWPEDAEWALSEAEGPDTDLDEAGLFWKMRGAIRSYIDSIATIDETLFTEVVAGVVMNAFAALQSAGSSALTWQQAELAMYLIYIFGEVTKVGGTRKAFFVIPQEGQTAKDRDRQRRASINSAATDSSCPTPVELTPEEAAKLKLNPAARLSNVYYGGSKDRGSVDHLPLTPLGELLTRAMASGALSYPHPGANLQFFEIAVRYVEFWRAKNEFIQPMLEAMLDSRGVHNPDESIRRRCYYLLNKFVKECRNDTDAAIVPAVLESLHDLLTVTAVLPEPDGTGDDLLVKATTGTHAFNDQLYLFETVGTLISLLKKPEQAEQQKVMLEVAASPLTASIMAGLNHYQQVGSGDLLAILQIHHLLLALGHFAKGFPPASDDANALEPTHAAAFKQMTEGVLQIVEIMKSHRVIRDAARFAFSQFVSTVGSAIAEFAPQFVIRIVSEFEESELGEFLVFLGLVTHKLKSNTFDTIELLLLPLLSRVFAVLQAPVTGTDDALIRRNLQTAYLQFLTMIINAGLQGIFLTDRNKGEFENVLSSLVTMALDASDPVSSKLAFAFLAKSIIVWGTSPEAAVAPSVFAESAQITTGKGAGVTNGHVNGAVAAQALPGFENFVYERLLPMCFEVPGKPEFKPKDGAYQLVMYEITSLLRATLTARGQEGVNYLLNDLLPRLQCPPDIANQLVTQLRTQSAKDFRRTFTEFVKASKA